MHSPEIDVFGTRTDEQGYSEVQLDISLNIASGDWERLPKLKSYQKQSRIKKISSLFQAVSNRLNREVIAFSQNQSEERALVLQKLRYLHEMLLQCLVLEGKGELQKNMVEPEIWELIK